MLASQPALAELQHGGDVVVERWRQDHRHEQQRREQGRQPVQQRPPQKFHTEFPETAMFRQPDGRLEQPPIQRGQAHGGSFHALRLRRRQGKQHRAIRGSAWSPQNTP
jgi:hypothetical protein